MEDSENKFILSFFVDRENQTECLMYIPENIDSDFERNISECLHQVGSEECSGQIKSAMQQYLLSQPSKIAECMRILALWTEKTEQQGKKPAIRPRDTLKPKGANTKNR